MNSLILPALLAIRGAHAWGDLGHQTIAFIAQDLMKETTVTWAQRILDDTSSSYLANVSTWADTWKYTSEGYFSQPFHYIDAEDNPPASCDVNFERDCGDAGCSVSAIANYTQRVQAVGSLSDTEIDYALRFLVHFIGDITQPLHDESFEIGGNEVSVTFDSEDTNLHSIWDTAMPEQLVGGYALSDAKAWAANLTQEIESGKYQSVADGWIEGLDIDDAQASAMVWAQDANRFVCSVVMPNNVTALENHDLYPTYYDSAIGTVELQIAKAGYRLAKWLDAITDKQPASRGQRLRVLRHPRSSGVDLGGSTFLPAKRDVRSWQKLRRDVVGFGCGHSHKH